MNVLFVYTKLHQQLVYGIYQCTVEYYINQQNYFQITKCKVCIQYVVVVISLSPIASYMLQNGYINNLEYIVT
jgi:hypothetical protein